MKNWTAFLIIAVAAGCGTVKTDGPVIKEWSKVINEKPVYYMTIDGVMVHEKD